MVGDIWYRYYDSGAWGYTRVILLECKVVRETEASVWLMESAILPYNKYPELAKRVLKNSKKGWAKPTVELAKESFLRRKEMQQKYLKSALTQSEEAVLIVTGKMKEKVDSLRLFGELE